MRTRARACAHARVKESELGSAGKRPRREDEEDLTTDITTVIHTDLTTDIATDITTALTAITERRTSVTTALQLLKSSLRSLCDKRGPIQPPKRDLVMFQGPYSS